MSNSAEKLVKQTIKLISKTQELDYEELKLDAKKLIKAARNFDENLLGMMEEIMDLGNVGSEEELQEFSPETLRIFLRIKEIDDTGSEKSLRTKVWNAIEEEFELDTDSESGESDSESESETEQEIVLQPEPVVEKPKKPKRKEVIIVE